MKYEPMRHQQMAYEFCTDRRRAGLFLGMGLGKTVVTLTLVAERLWDNFSIKNALVIAPKNVAENVWAQECLKWDHTKDIRCSLIMGTAKQRARAVEAKAELYITNRDNIVWLVDYHKGKLPYDLIILDELSSFKNHQTQRWKALRKAITPEHQVLGLTGTPAPNSYLDLWPEIFLLDGGERLGKKIGDYRNRYFTVGAHKGHIVYEYRLRMGAQDAINRKLRDLCLSMKSEDWLHLPPIIYNTVPVAMGSAERAEYERFEKEKVIPLLKTRTGFERLDPNNAEELEQMTNVVKADTAAVVAGKLMQMANGAVYDDEGNIVTIHDEKLRALDEIAEANAGKNLLVFYNYQHDLDRILAKFPHARVFSGPEDEQAWNRGEIPMLLCHPASTGHGLNLQFGGHIIVWFGLTWSLELYQQANARLPRPGQKESVIIHHLVCRDTIDERVINALKGKEATQNTLLNALKGYLLKEETT